MATITRVVGRSGRQYLVECILQEKVGPLGHVYLASQVPLNVRPSKFTNFSSVELVTNNTY